MTPEEKEAQAKIDAKYKLTPAESGVYNIMYHEGPFFSLSDLADRCYMGENNLRRVIDSLIKKEQVTEQEDGRYCTTAYLHELEIITKQMRR